VKSEDEKHGEVIWKCD